MTRQPAGVDPIVPRFTQDLVIAKGEKTRAQVLGEPVIIDDKKPDAEIRADLVASLTRPDDYVIVNYRRAAVGQPGGGHVSPLGAYVAASDSFLVLDVNPAAASWVRMPTTTLVKGMRTFDTIENRGYVLVSPR